MIFWIETGHLFFLFLWKTKHCCLQCLKLLELLDDHSIIVSFLPLIWCRQRSGGNEGYQCGSKSKTLILCNHLVVLHSGHSRLYLLFLLFIYKEELTVPFLRQRGRERSLVNEIFWTSTLSVKRGNSIFSPYIYFSIYSENGQNVDSLQK